MWQDGGGKADVKTSRFLARREVAGIDAKKAGRHELLFFKYYAYLIFPIVSET